MSFVVLEGTFHLVGRTSAGNPSGFEPDGDSIQFKPTDPTLLERLDRVGRPFRLTAIVAERGGLFEARTIRGVNRFFAEPFGAARRAGCQTEVSRWRVFGRRL